MYEMYDYEDEQTELLCHAAKRTFEVFAWLKAKVPKSVKDVLDRLRRDVFEPGYTVARLRKTLRQRSTWFITAFGRVLGLTPWSLTRECRLETAARLLRDTSLRVLDVTLLVGYDSESAFSDRFRGWCGLRPKQYRRHARAMRARLAAPPEETFSWERWQSLCDGDLDAEACEDLIATLEKLRDA
jgi:AraC-like DNA-binding protein